MVRSKRALAFLLSTLGLVGCQQQQTKVGQARPVLVEVSSPVKQDVIDYEEFTGRTDAVLNVSVRAQVTGYLSKLNFKDGSDVKEGDVLFEIDARPYEAELARAEATLAQADAHLKRLETDLKRASLLLPRGGIPREEYDRIAGDHAEAVAAAGIYTGNLRLARLNLKYTKVTAPFSGRISRRLVDPGNLVKAFDTVLTTIVSLDPMYVYFDIDESTSLGLTLVQKSKLADQRKAEGGAAGGIAVKFRLVDEVGFPHEATVNFVDNRMEAGTGTLRVRGIFSNPTKMFSPGLFVRVQVPVSDPHPALLVNQQALGTDQGRRFLYLANARNEVVYRPVTIGATENDLCVIKQGVSLGELVIVSGLQQIRPASKVETKTVDMISLAPTFSAGDGPVAAKVEKASPKTQAEAKTKTGPPPKVLVSLPISRMVVDHEEFTGHAEGVASVDIRARVTGYLDKLNFKDGSDVREGDVLFEIDPRPYEADVERAKANLLQAHAHLKRLNTDYNRASGLRARNSITPEEFDRISGDHAEAEAAVGMAKASYEAAWLNLEFTKVTAPISGRVSRRMIDPGNMVRADDTILTSIITLDPMYTYFDIDEGTMLRLRRLVQAGKIRSARDVTLPVAFRLSDEHDFPHHSVIDFADNKVDPTKGTLEVRSVFDNPKKNLAPGLFVRVQVPVGAPHKAVLVNEQALSTDQGRRFLYVVNSKDQVESEKRFVDVGLADDGLRVIEKGLSLGERVIVSGLQREAQWARADNKVKPTLVDMLTFKPITEISAKGESAAGPPPTD